MNSLSEESKRKRTITASDGEIVVEGTGEVVGYVTDMRREYRTFDDEQVAKRERVGAPLTYGRHDKGLSTAIDWHDRDVFGKGFSPSQKSQMYRLRKWQKRTAVSGATEKNLAIELIEINKICNSLALPKSVYEESCVIYRKAVNEDLIRGRSMNDMAAASIRLSCREYGLNRTLDDIVSAMKPGLKRDSAEFKDARKKVSHAFGDVVEELDYYNKNKPLDGTKLISKYTKDPEKYSRKTMLFNEISNQGRVEDVASKIFNAAKENKLTSGRGPVSIAAASTYIAEVLVKGNGLYGGKPAKTQREIASIAQVTEVTIRNRYKELLEKLQIDFSL
jgi:transcription initiation factor TFIIB